MENNIHGQRESNNFLILFKKNLLIELNAALLFMLTIFAVVSSFLYGCFNFLLEFKTIKEAVKQASTPIVVFFIGEYFTVLTKEVVIIVTVLSVLVPQQFVRIPLIIAVLYAFFNTFLL